MAMKKFQVLISVILLITALTACEQTINEDIPPQEDTNITAQQPLPGDTSETVDPVHGKTVEEMLAEKNDAVPAIEVNGTRYVKNTAVSNYLLIGVDKASGASDDEYGGQCDVIQLIVLDGANKKYTTVQFNRDTMTEVDIQDSEGELTGIRTTQSLAFAHSYGNGTEKSCENVVRAVSRIMGGIDINGYISLQYDAIPVLNDIVGDIYVTIEDDFSKADKTLVQGETVELTGQHALNFVRARMNVGDGENIGRLRRQRTYMAAFSARLKEELSDNSAIINTMYNAAQPYMVTDMSVGSISNLAVKALGYVDGGVVTPAGELRYVPYDNGNTYAEFYLDEAALAQLTQDLFYTQSN